MRRAQPSLYSSTASIGRSYIVPPSTTIASAFWSGSATTSHAPSRGNAKALIRKNGAERRAPRMRMRFNSTNSGPMSRGRKRKLNQLLAELPFNQPHVSGPRSLLRFLDGELDALAFPKQLEHRAPHGAAMKEMLQAGFITDEAEALVD